MADGFGQTQLYVDSENIRQSLKKIGIGPWFGSTELRRSLNNHHADGKIFADSDTWVETRRRL